MEIKWTRNFLRDKFIFSAIVATLFFNAANWVIVGRSASWQFNVLPLHYNIYFGIDWFGPAIYLYMYPGLAFIILFLNLVLAWGFFGRRRFLSYLFVAIALLVNIFFLVAGSLVILTNIM